jgi:phage shock protein E
MFSGILSSKPNQTNSFDMKFVLKHKLTIIGTIAGAIAGYLYYHFVGCAGGTCAITSKPMNSTLYGAVMGGLVFNLFKSNQPN